MPREVRVLVDRKDIYYELSKTSEINVIELIDVASAERFPEFTDLAILVYRVSPLIEGIETLSVRRCPNGVSILSNTGYENHKSDDYGNT